MTPRAWALFFASTVFMAASCREGTSPSPEPPDTTPPLAAVTERSPPEVVSRTYRAMGTQIAFSAYTSEPDRARGAFEAAIAEFRRLEDLHSNWKPRSDISQLNAWAGKRPVEVAPETLDLLERAQAMHALTDGKFDVGFGALADLWRFDHDQDNRIPAPGKVKARLPLVDAAAIRIDREHATAFLPKVGMTVHVGGIGKGFAVDRAAALLRERGLADFIIQAGGDLYASGRRGDRPWRVGIRDPRGPPTRFFAFAELENRTFSTSGDYERFFIKEGVRYHHIIDPDTGRPATGMRSVTVLAPTAVQADALSTGVFILGVERGLALVEATEDVGAILVDAENRVHVSKRLKGKVRIVHPPSP